MKHSCLLPVCYSSHFNEKLFISIRLRMNQSRWNTALRLLQAYIQRYYCLLRSSGCSVRIKYLILLKLNFLWHKFIMVCSESEYMKWDTSLWKHLNLSRKLLRKTLKNYNSNKTMKMMMMMIIQFNSILFMCWVNSCKANYRHSAV
jgi:hypothetical protein